jgi:tRNA(Arg) A34 adenosine deaminase TadA
MTAENGGHETFMRRAIELARGNPAAPFAAILVERDTGRIVAEGINRHAENPTWHGEIDVINRHAATGRAVEWERLRLYTTAEPCCMCQGAILWAGIPEVVYGTSIRTLQRFGWKQIDLTADEVARRTAFTQCRLIGGVLEAECDELFRRAGSWTGERLA